MIALDEDALICDFAETYHIYNIYSLPVEYVATLAVGLKSDSRIRMAMSGLRVDVKTLLLAHIADNTAINAWLNSQDAINGTNRPKSMVGVFRSETQTNEAAAFDNGDDFIKEWERLNNE